MADGINVKMGVTGLSQFKQAMSQAQQSVKTYDAALKLNEKQLQATGDKEQYMAERAKILQKQIAAQTTVVKQGEAALKAMDKNGVDPASKAYQSMQQQVLKAQTALIGMNSDLQHVGDTAAQTAGKTEDLASALNSIDKKVTFNTVLNGIGAITSAMSAAAQKIAQIATDVWNTLTTAASWADNENTLAAMYGIDVEKLQQMQGASRIIDTSVEAIIKSRQKLKQNMASDSKEISAAFKELGVSMMEWGEKGVLGNPEWVARNWEDVFWDLGDALVNYEGKMDRDVLANQLFGRSWMELMPLFDAGREEYEKTLSEQSIVTEEHVDQLNALDDALQKLDQDYQATKNTILSELAPAFTTVAETVSTLIQEFNQYLQTEKGQEQLEALGGAFTSLVEGFTDIDFTAAVAAVASGLQSITDSLKWIKENGEIVLQYTQGIFSGTGILGFSFGRGVSKNIAENNKITTTPAAAQSTEVAEKVVETTLDERIAKAEEAMTEGLFDTALQAAVDLFNSGLSAGDLVSRLAQDYDADFNQLQDIPMMDALYNVLSEDTANAFDRLMEDILDGTQLDPASVVTLLETIKTELLAASEANPPVVKTTPQFPADVGSILQNQLAGVALHVPVVPNAFTDGSHANGLPFVPFDGYIAALHKGERVVPAAQNKSFTNNSNLYVDRMIMQNNTDVQGLAAAIAERSRRAMAGFGG